MGNTHYVKVLSPAIGAKLYLLQGWSIGNFKPFILVAVINGKSAMTVTEHSFELLSQGRERDCYGNTSVSHSYAIGSVYAVPATSEGLRIKKYNYAAQNQNSVTGYNWYLGSVYIHCDLVRNWYPGNDEINSFNHYYNMTTVEVKQVNYGKPYSDSFANTEFFVDYKNIYNTRYRTTVTTNKHVNPKMGQYSETTSTTVSNNWANVIDLGTVLSVSYDTEYLRPTVLSAYQDPNTLLVDLYKKIGVPQVNNCENLTQLRKWRELAPPFKALIRKHNIKSLAELYLWWKYSYSTSKMDIEEYFDWFKTLASQKANNDNICHYSLTYNLASDDVLRYNFYTSPYSIGVIEALGLDINLSNTWDLLPFSFVVDWFLTVGDSLHSIDVSNLDSKLDLKTLIVSRKTVRDCPTTFEAHVIGRIKWSSYTRQLETQLPPAVCGIHFNNPSSHLLDATSLIIANKK